MLDISRGILPVRGDRRPGVFRTWWDKLEADQALREYTDPQLSQIVYFLLEDEPFEIIRHMKSELTEPETLQKMKLELDAEVRALADAAGFYVFATGNSAQKGDPPDDMHAIPFGEPLVFTDKSGKTVRLTVSAKGSYPAHSRHQTAKPQRGLTRLRCPPDSVIPLSPIVVSSP